MALQIDYKLGGDYNVQSAYVRIRSITIEYNSQQFDGYKFVIRPVLEVRSSKNKNVIDVWSGMFWITPYDHTSNVNAIKQTYLYLKTLPDFTEATNTTD